MKRHDTFKMTVPNDVSYLPIVQLCVRELSKMSGFDSDDIYKIELGLEETFMGVVEHAFEKNEDNTFDIVCKRVPRGIEITVKEQGMPFDPKRLSHYALATDIDSASTSGLGTCLTKAAFDEVSFSNLGSQGKETRLVKYLKSANITGYFTDSELEEEKEAAMAATPITEKIDYDIRLMKPEEAIEVSKGAYKTHGYTIFDDSLYYPEQIVELNKTGMMVSALAVTKDNTVMGHCALVYPYPGAGIAELTFVFVNPEYRGQGCIDRFSYFLEANATQHGLKGLYFHAVTNHIYVQRSADKFGFVISGIVLAVSPATWLFKGIDGDTTQRISCAMGFKYLKKPEILTLYPPLHHLEMIEKIYGWMGVKHDCKSPDFSEPVFTEEHSVIETVTNDKEGNAVVIVTSYGSNILKEIKTILRNLCIQQFSNIELYVKLEDPLTYFLTSQFEKIGFFFSGVLPNILPEDALILQYLNNVMFDYEKLRMYTDYSKEILAYIKSCDPNIG